MSAFHGISPQHGTKERVGWEGEIVKSGSAKLAASRGRHSMASEVRDGNNDEIRATSVPTDDPVADEALSPLASEAIKWAPSVALDARVVRRISQWPR